MADDKLYDLVEKMYVEFSGQFKTMNHSMESMETELKDVKKTVIHIEQDHGSKIAALFDGQKTTNEKLDHVIDRLEDIESKIESHDIRIAVLDKRKRHIK